MYAKIKLYRDFRTAYVDNRAVPVCDYLLASQAVILADPALRCEEGRPCNLCPAPLPLRPAGRCQYSGPAITDHESDGDSGAVF